MKQILTLCLLAFLGVTAVNAQAPVITSFTPLTAKPGDAVTLTGTGFNTTAANNIVFCGATKATVTSATATSVTITVPTGATHDYITLLNTGTGLATMSRAKLLPTFSPAKTGFTNIDLDTAVNITTNNGPGSIVIADIDGNGKPDLVVSYTSTSGISVYRNTSTPGSINSSSFAAKVDFSTTTNPMGIAVGDLDGGGKPDIAVVNLGTTGYT
jgi:nitrous oxidase accessory protein NosD